MFNKTFKISTAIVLVMVVAGFLLYNTIKMPYDFVFVYEWVGKLVPAPEHYEYIISVERDGYGKLSYYADYGIGNVDESKLWQRKFNLTVDQQKQLYYEMKNSKLFTERFKNDDLANFRENYANLMASINKISYNVKIGETSDLQYKELGDIIKKVVPADVWAEMEKQHEVDISRNNDVLDYELPVLD